MTFHRKPSTNTLTIAAMVAAASAPAPDVVYIRDDARPGGAPSWAGPPSSRGGKYNGPRNKPPSQKKRRLLDRRRGRFS